MTQAAKKGDIVQIHYTGTIDDGFIFDSSRNGEPLQFKIGEGFLLEDFESALIDMAIGESKIVKITCDKAYGTYQPNLVLTIPKKEFPPHINAEVGQQLQINNPNTKEPVVVMITDISDTTITLDANHPLAGKDLTFDIELIAIV